MVRVRLAPSPTGTLHRHRQDGCFQLAVRAKLDGSFLLRIEDTDKERSKPEFTQNILEGLQWLGIDWDGDPVIQSEQRTPSQCDSKSFGQGAGLPLLRQRRSWTYVTQQKAANQAPVTTIAIATSHRERSGLPG